jgi:hypothetical protein
MGGLSSRFVRDASGAMLREKETAMRTLILLLALAGCAGPPSATNATADKAPPQAPQAPPPPQGPVQTADAYRVTIDANEAPFRVPGTVTARLNEEVRLGDLRVRPLEVLEDSRCPVDVTCVWAGRVRLRVAVGGAGERVMEIGPPVPVPGGAHLTLVAVAPLNWANPPAGVDANAPKRFGFRLSGMD